MDRLSTKGQMIDQIDLSEVAHSGFDRSNHNYLSGKLGAIIPTRLDEVYPGDRIKGSPTMVANFEPLAAPIMGSMVLKQESFYVPLPQVWRHAYKFFTGKNGFNELMPSISPRSLVQRYTFLTDFFDFGNETGLGIDILVSQLHAFYDALNLDNKSFSEVNGVTLWDALTTFAGSLMISLENTYGPRKMSDLVRPIIDHVFTQVHSTLIGDTSAAFESDDTTAAYKRRQLLEHVPGFIGGLLRDIWFFFFGPSSLLDYIGWPIYTDDMIRSEVTIPEWNLINIFQYNIYRNILIYGSVSDTFSSLHSLASNIPLVFLPFKAYYLTWYWNYRDQLLETEILDPEEDEFLGSEITDNVVLYCTLMRQRCWLKDAYTTALTNTGDGNLIVPVTSTSSEPLYKWFDAQGNLINTSDAEAAYNAGATVFEVENGNYTYRLPMNYLFGAHVDNYVENDSNHSFSLDMFDRIQRLRSVIQKRLILGYEVDDVIYSSFMVQLSNVRMHIPEILSRGRDSVEINTLVNNTSTDQQIAGDKTATAFARGTSSEVNYFSEEWGFYIQFATIMPIQSYSGGMQRLFLKRDPLDWMWPEYATMGMDAVYNCELAAPGKLTDETAMLVFGYQGRYYDLKYRQDEEHGRLRTDLNYLTFSREFDEQNKPLLNYMFVHCWPRLDAFVIESPLEDVFRADCYTAQGWERRLPVPSNYVH